MTQSGTTVLVLLVGGSPRSGTTLLSDLLARASDQVVVTPESQFKFDAIRHVRPLTAARCLAYFRKHPRFQLWPIEHEELVVREASSKHPVAQAMEAVVHHYASAVGIRDPRTWVDHTPNNVRHFLTLKEVFPGARLVHLVRDPRAVCSSILDMEWGPITTRHAAKLWMAYVANGLAAEASCGSDTVLRVHYEALVQDPESVVSRIIQWAEIEGDPTGRGAVPPSFYGDRYHSLVGRPPDRSRIDGWKRRLSTTQVAIVEGESTDLMRALGYEPRAYPRITADGMARRASEHVTEALIRPVKQLQYRLAMARYRAREHRR